MGDRQLAHQTTSTIPTSWSQKRQHLQQKFKKFKILKKIKVISKFKKKDLKRGPNLTCKHDQILLPINVKWQKNWEDCKH